MQIPIPRFIVRTWDMIEDWINVPLWQRTVDVEVRRIDVLMLVLFIFTVAWYGYWYSWQGALQGSVGFIVCAALALYCRRRE